MTSRARVSLEGNTVVTTELDGFVRFSREWAASTTPASLSVLLERSRRLPGFAKLALTRDSRIVLVADRPNDFDGVPLDEPDLERAREVLENGSALAMTNDDEPSPSAVAGLLDEMSLEHRESSEGSLVVPLPGANGHLVRLVAGSGWALRASLAAVDLSGRTPDARWATLVFFLRANACLRFARVSSCGEQASFELCFEALPEAALLAHAFGALGAAARFHYREAEALEDENLARMYLEASGAPDWIRSPKQETKEEKEHDRNRRPDRTHRERRV